MPKILLLALAGACGTLGRYWLSNATYHVLGRDFPWGTAMVNVVGCMLFGLVVVLAEERGLIHDEIRVILLVGFMGSFTTFSSLIFETGELARASLWLHAGLNMAGQTALGFAAYALGTALGRSL